MVIYICEKCNKNFGNRKSNYIYHINKINSCENNINISQNATKTIKLIQQNATKIDNLEKIKYFENNEVNIKNEIKLEIPKINIQETKLKYICEHCNYCFTRNSSFFIYKKFHYDEITMKFNKLNHSVLNLFNTLYK